MVGVGLIMIPLPTPFGCVVAGAGMAVLGTEFPQAQRILDQTRDAVVDVIEKNCGEDGTPSTIQEEPPKEPMSTNKSQKEEEEESSIDHEKEHVGVVRNDSDPNGIPQGPPPQELPPPLRRPIMEEFSLGNIRNSIKRRAKALGQKAVPILKMIGTKEASANTCSDVDVIVDGNVDKVMSSEDKQPPLPQTALPAYDVVPELSPLSLEAHNVPSWSSLSLTGSSGTYDECP